MTPLGAHPQWFETTWNRYMWFLLLWNADLYIKKSPNDRNFPIISWLNIISHFQIAIFWHNTLCQSRKKGSSSSTGEKEICSTKTHSKTFPACFYIPIFFPIWIIVVLILDLRNLQEQKKNILLPKIGLTFYCLNRLF